MAGNVDDDAIYLLVDPFLHARRQPGTLAARRATWTPTGPELPHRAGRHRGLAQIRNFDLPGGYHLLIGRDVEAQAQLRHLLADAMLWAAASRWCWAVFGASAVRGLFQATIADVSAAAVAVSAGDLTRRVRVAGLGDEFDLLAEAINDMLDRIERLMDGVRQVSNAIAHDLRTPIARARARLEDAAEHAKTAADLQAAIERAQADLDGVVSVFEALLRIAEIEAGARRSAFAPLDLAPLLRDLGELYEAAAEARGQRLVQDIPPSLPVFGDRDMLQQAVANLLDNALKFAPPGSAIRLSAAARRRTGIGSWSPMPARASPKTTASAPPNASFAARPRATRPAPAWGSRWCRRWRTCMADRCGWRTTALACVQHSPSERASRRCRRGE